ncbi:MAG TPA: 3-deoxy-D-manno-octulosonic acid transferase, partial [Tepidisphaeraceae bacterium]|nr:3-deoxy-D-manno-octulosonic acid transferase [Tepidisphaeraceae bacterium]
MPAVFIHAVSLGEINATRQLVRRLSDRGPLHLIVSTTTDTGYARAMELYGSQADMTVVRFPLDFSWAVSRILDNLRPSVVALMELEVWPNFMAQCRKRNIPVVLINGRLTETSFRRYRSVRPLVSGMFRSLTQICAQEQDYAERFIELGADPKRVSVTGTMKFDTAQIAETIPGAPALAAAVGLSPGAGQVWVCGSTGPGEEPLLIECYGKLLGKFPRLRLVLVPRKPERFNDVAETIAAAGFHCVRRSRPDVMSDQSIILGDTMGELNAWYSLADVVFVGRTLLDLGPRQHGSDMIEPAALGKPVIVGPYTGNFAEPMAKFVEAEAIRVIAGMDELESEASQLLSDPEQARALGERARQVVQRERGATDRHVAAILAHVAHGD